MKFFADGREVPSPPVPDVRRGLLAPGEQIYIAHRAQWYFDCAFSPRSSPNAFGDNVTFTGQGLPDLERTIVVITANPTVRIICEVGASGTVMLGNAFPKYLPCNVHDLEAIRDEYIAYYGSVDRPPVYRAFSSGAFQIVNGTVVGEVDITGTAAGSNSPYA
jgi:hypothetical protein